MTQGIEGWFRERPRWLQTAAALRLEKGALEQTDYTRLASLSLKEAGDPSIDQEFLVIPTGSLEDEPDSEPLRLKSVSSMTGINALKPGKPLEFDTAAITIIYGDTGAGKSGYSRLLGHVCGSRFASDLHGDAFSTPSPQQAANITVQRGGIEETLNWRRQEGPLKLLRRVHVFDTECARRYVANATEPAHEPFVLRLLSAVISDCAKVEHKLHQLSTQYPSKLPLFPEALRDGVRSIWYSQLRATTSPAAIDDNCAFSADDARDLFRIEMDLTTQNPRDVIADFAKRRIGIGGLIKDLQLLEGSFSEVAGAEVRALRNDARTRRADVIVKAQQLFENAPLPGIGEDAWRRMWEAAREYSEGIAYVGRAFPVVEDEALCVLCQQPLNEGGVRLVGFETFIRDALEASAKKAENNLLARIAQILSVPELSGFQARFEAAGILVATDVPALHREVQQRNQWITADNSDPAPPLGLGIAIEELQILDAEYEAKIAELKTLEKDEERSKKQIRLRELRARQWLSQQIKSIEVEIERLKVIRFIDVAIDKTSTAQITRKKNDLSEQLLAANHRDRFAAELRNLGGEGLPIRISHTRAEKAEKPGFELALANAKQDLAVAAVLSEGENRVVALASFFADVTAGPADVPFVFDDPISSLDQNYEEATARRLVVESTKRQVIVFTHRLSLVAALFDAAEKSGIACSLQALREGPDGKGTPGESFINENNPDKALRRLLNDRLPKAQNAFEIGDHVLCNEITKSICSDFRILMERLIERVLLNNVVERFRRSVITRGRLHNLALITTEDCTMLDDLMTAYSFPLHSQPTQAPVKLPNLAQLRADLQKMIDWAAEFKCRS